ncbi:MAG: ATP-binding protein [Anaerolineae bacterium]|nr:ATP-binding protein [Anaerolineae bacterium]
MLTLPDFPVRQRDFLLEISRAITSRLDLTEVLKRVLHASVVMTAGRVGLIALRNPDDQQFNVRAFTGIQQEIVPLINEKLHELMNDVPKTALHYDYIESKLTEIASSIDEGLRQSVAMPLLFDKSPMGLLIVFRSYEVEVTRNDVQILQSFADQAAIAVHNAQLYENINRERQQLRAILDYSGDGVMILDANLNILQINRSFEYMSAWRAEDAVSLHQDDVIIWANIEHNDLQDAIQQGWPQKRSESEASDTLYVEGELQRRDGMEVSIGITYAPLFNEDGKLANIIANVRDITNFRKAQEMQNVFISTVSHELRTPVTLIKGYASTLTREDAQWDMNTVKQSLEVIEEEADRLTELIEDLLTASKIQADRNIKLNLADVRLDQIAKHSLERLRVQSTRHEFVLSFQDNFPTVSGDAKLLRQVIDNLLTNAIKYSPSGGTITIGGRYSGESVTIFVRDSGEGIAEEEQRKIFERFYRIDSKLTSKTQGTGLGLYLSKAIIEAHNGNISVKSHIGHGSTFYFTIPRN